VSFVRSYALSDRLVRDTGHDIFHGNVGSGMSCASCHGEARDDGHTWNFSDVGPRRTQNIRGGLLSTLPLHWEGDLADMNALVSEVMTISMGGFAASPEHVQALGSWLDKLPSLRLAASDAAAAERGKRLFEASELGCASCHSGPMLTNNETVDVGTGGLFQVPSLRGLALHPPFMHTGCAAQLEDRFNVACGGSRHGDTSRLSSSQLSDLVVYLKAL
jgi:mono/diheme cytochrome c family protein